jgi:CDP-diacylglycerol--glycerol-3-phosphate 3-phosphatidyltransferase
MLSGMSLIGDNVGRFFSAWRDWWARGLGALRITPNKVTIFGTLLTIGAAVCYCQLVRTELWTWGLYAGLFLFGSFGCDMLDGAVARITGKASPFGAFLDSTMDRVSDFALWAGVALGYLLRETPNITYAVWCMLGFFWAVMISYTKARAEDFIDGCGVGYWQRPERSVAWIVSAFAFNPAALVLQQGTLPALTLARRMWHTHGKMKGREMVVNCRENGRWYHRLAFWLYPRASWPYDIASIIYILFCIVVRYDAQNYDVLRQWLL